MTDINKAQFAFDKAKMGFLSVKGSPFLATILFGMKHSFSTEVPTLGTSGLELVINPDFFLKIPEKQREAELAHECWHVALDHISRLYDRDFDTWNIATDYAINIMMHDSGKYQMDNTWLLDPQYRGMTADVIYTKLMQQKKPNGGSGGNNNGNGTGNNPNGNSSGNSGNQPQAPQHMFKPKTSDGNNTMSQSATTAAVQQLVAKAATMAKQRNESFGYVPGGLEQLLEPVLKPKLNWRVLLMRFVASFKKDDYSYRRFNRRYLPDYYMPTLYNEAVGEIAAAFDDSASVSDNDFKIMLGQVKQIQQMLSPEITRVVTFDTKIQNEYTYRNNKQITKFKLNGRGGTDVNCVFEHFNKHPPKVLIIFSDMDFYMPKQAPKYPVIWVGVGVYRTNITVPFGKYFEIKD